MDSYLKQGSPGVSRVRTLDATTTGSIKQEQIVRGVEGKLGPRQNTTLGHRGGPDTKETETSVGLNNPRPGPWTGLLVTRSEKVLGFSL